MRIKLADIPLHERTAEFFKQAVEYDWWNIAEVPVEMRTEDMCLYCLSQSTSALSYVPDDLFTPDVCIAALKIHGATQLQDYQMTGFTPAFKAKAEGVIQSLEKFVRQVMPSLNKEDKKVLTLLLCNPCNENFNLDYHDLLLTCAEIAARKAYSFRPTVLDGLNQFTEYLKILKTATPPCRERFTIYAGHTFSGEIQMQNKKANQKQALAFLDVLIFLQQRKKLNQKHTKHSGLHPAIYLYLSCEAVKIFLKKILKIAMRKKKRTLLIKRA